MISILKNGSASTLQVANGVKTAMARVLKTVTENVEVKQFADQSVFVKAAISGVVREGLIAACLTATMLLLFLGSWRSTIIVATSIPLSILASLAILSALGETINLMTLGGLAWMMRPSSWKTPIARWRSANRSTRRYSMARSKSRCRLSFPLSAFASCSSRCSS
jgi:multidrug efflux pump subunit AcrB